MKNKPDKCPLNCAKWLPIETAPDTPIDLWSKSHGRLTNYIKVIKGPKNIYFQPLIGGVCVVRDATHWMEIPKPPVSV